MKHVSMHQVDQVYDRIHFLSVAFAVEVSLKRRGRGSGRRRALFPTNASVAGEATSAFITAAAASVEEALTIEFLFLFLGPVCVIAVTSGGVEGADGFGLRGDQTTS